MRNVVGVESNFLLKKVVFLLWINFDLSSSLGDSFDGVLDEKPAIKFDSDAYFRDDEFEAMCLLGVTAVL
jgi:hypothetical protein